MKTLCICGGAIAYVCLRVFAESEDVSKGLAFMMGAVWAMAFMIIGAIVDGII